LTDFFCSEVSGDERTEAKTEEPDPETEIKYNLLNALKNNRITKEQLDNIYTMSST